MLGSLPETVDAWRMVAARREFEGTLPLAAMPRLADRIANGDGEAHYVLGFDRDALNVAFIDLQVDAAVTLICQRSLEPFVLPLKLKTRLGLISNENEEAALPSGYEPLLLRDPELRPAAVIEDELLLALPLVPVDPDSEWPEQGWSTAPEGEAQEPRENPFAVLRELKH